MLFNKKNLKKHYYHIPAILWYLIFVGLVPYSLKSLYGFDVLRFYFPIIDLIANSFAASSQSDDIFRDLYSTSPNNIFSFISTNFINLLALLGVSWNGILYAFDYNDVWVGVTVTLFMYVVTYLLPTQLIPIFINYTQNKIPINIHYKIGDKTIYFEDYIASVLIIIVLVVIEGYLISRYIKSV